MTAQCPRCGRPLADGTAICRPDALRLAQTLQDAAGHAEDAETVIARQARYGGASRGGSSEPLPVDLTAAAKLAPIENTIHTWTRTVLEQTRQQLPPWRPAAGPLCPPTGTRCTHDSCDTIRRRWPISPTGQAALWLARQVDWLRRHPAAGEAFAELHDACEQLARLVDRPAGRELVGMCDCGRTLYAPPGRTVVQCPEPTCQLRWEVAESRDILRRALDDRLFTAAEAARLAVHLDGGDRSTEQVRKLIGKWHERGLIEARGQVDVQLDGSDEHGAPKARADPLFRFGDVADRLAATPRRNREGAAA